MTEVDYYENVRQKLTLGHNQIPPPPKHKLIYKLLKLFWNEEEIKILAHFHSAAKSITLEELENSPLNKKLFPASGIQFNGIAIAH